MPIDPELDEMMAQRIGHLAAATIDGYGRRTYRAPVEIGCHIDGKSVDVVTAEGSTVSGSGTCWLNGHYPDIGLADRIVLPEGGDRGLVEVQTVYDESGPHHTKLIYGAT